jgi:hypothetical protein
VKATLGSFDYLRFLGVDSFRVGDGDLLVAGEVGTYDGPWTLPGDLLKLNTVVRYPGGTTLNGYSVTGMAYGNHWNSTDQIPEPAVPYIGLYGYEDPTDGGNTERFSLSGQWAKTDGANSWHVNVFAVRSDLNLWNNFTYFLVNPALGDQFHQHETRTFGGADASYILTGNIAGVPTENEIGVQTRFDAINLLRRLDLDGHATNVVAVEPLADIRVEFGFFKGPKDDAALRARDERFGIAGIDRLGDHRGHLIVRPATEAKSRHFPGPDSGCRNRYKDQGDRGAE